MMKHFKSALHKICRKPWLPVALLALGAGLTSCQDNSDYLHHTVEEPPKTLSFSHKLKEMQGENKVDILWVIDNSGSMGSHQRAVISNSDLFMTNFLKKGGLDWKMGLISTDENKGPYVGFSPSRDLKRGTPNALRVFNDAVGQLGTSGSGTEKPFKSVQNNLQNFPKFLRSNAILALIILTDASEQSRIPGSDFAAFMKQMKGSLKRIVSYGVLGPLDFGCQATDDRWNFKNSPYEEFQQLVAGGKNYPLCSPDFGKNLADLGKDLVKRVQSPRIRLKYRPQVQTIEISYQGKPLPGGPKEEGGFWYYDFDLNSIVFHDLDFAPGENEAVTIKFVEAYTSLEFEEDVVYE